MRHEQQPIPSLIARGLEGTSGCGLRGLYAVERRTVDGSGEFPPKTPREISKVMMGEDGSGLPNGKEEAEYFANVKNLGNGMAGITSEIYIPIYLRKNEEYVHAISRRSDVHGKTDGAKN